ncbi:hypothetical protein SCAR479_00257 [Seiridium cardinale]|uniref:Uncharacterized protein n=1 Tax=Seiridium cardinale TaxID=138064 RepID=A0ABR2Y9E4_9PEZI
MSLVLIMVTTVQASPFTAAASISSRNSSTLSTATTFAKALLSSPTATTTVPAPTKGGCGQNATASSAVPDVRVTPPPAGGVFFEPGSEANAADVNVKFKQTTYYTCVTWPSTVHCGWHEPILDASMDGAWSQYDSKRAAMLAVFFAVVGIVLGL